MHVGGKEGKDCLWKEASYLREGNHLEIPFEYLKQNYGAEKKNRVIRLCDEVNVFLTTKRQNQL